MDHEQRHIAFHGVALTLAHQHSLFIPKESRQGIRQAVARKDLGLNRSRLGIHRHNPPGGVGGRIEIEGEIFHLHPVAVFQMDQGDGLGENHGRATAIDFEVIDVGHFDEIPQHPRIQPIGACGELHHGGSLFRRLGNHLPDGLEIRALRD